MSYTLLTNSGEVQVYKQGTSTVLAVTSLVDGRVTVIHLYEAQAVKLAAALLAEATK